MSEQEKEVNNLDLKKSKLHISKDEKKDVILIVGDWVVDEYWFLVRHYSDISSHTGFVHYRLDCDPGDPISGLCAAGHVARVIYRLQEEDRDGHKDKNENFDYNIAGLGKWHPKDTDHIKHLIHARVKVEDELNGKCDSATANYRITYAYKDTCNIKSPSIQLFPLDDDSPTIRVIRMYHQKEGGFEQINRVDWELEDKNKCFNEDIITNIKKELGDRVKYIVVHDSRKGVVTSELINALLKYFGEARWFVRSKTRNPEWLKNLKDKLEILFIGPEVASTMSPWDNWIIKGNATDTALEGIGNLPWEAGSLPWNDNKGKVHEEDGKEENIKNKDELLNEPFVILISNQHEVIIRTKEYYYTGRSGVIPASTSQLGWPSAFFASMVHLFFLENAAQSERKEEDPQDMKKEIEKALKWADDYGGVDLPHRSKQLKKFRERELVVYYSNRKRIDLEWKYARRGNGVINEVKVKEKLINLLSENSFNKEFPNNTKEIKDKEAGNKKVLRLDVWRGSTLLPGYICSISEKKDIINRIGRRLKSFASTEFPARSLSIMLQADPGAGKTHLAKSLAKLFDFEFIRYDITQMIHRDELLDLFDSVATMQANTRKKVLVFVDEVNALLDGSHAYGAFLAPLEEGIYIRRGNYFSLKPCVWIFAGTNLEDDSLSSDEKLSDFKSRMELIEKIDYKSLSANPKSAYAVNLQSEARLEQVYLGAILIKSFFSDVQEVSYEVLQYFFDMDPAQAPARKIRKLTASLRNVQYGSISRKNCTNWENVKWVDDKDCDTPVRLIFSPPPPNES